jgi:hypothetical protein
MKDFVWECALITVAQNKTHWCANVNMVMCTQEVAERQLASICGIFKDTFGLRQYSVYGWMIPNDTLGKIPKEAAKC